MTQIIIVVMLWLGSLALTLAALPLRGLNAAPRRGAIALLVVLLFAIPIVFVWLEPSAPGWLRAIIALLCPVLAVKLLDAHRGEDDWRQMTVGQWLTFLLNPYVLCHRAHGRERPRPTSANVRLLARGVLEMAAGALVLWLAFHHDFDRSEFWLEHAIKLVGAYLLIFDGMFVTLTGLLRVLGCNVMDLSNHPILALTPADFWRRYNRDPGRFFLEDIFKPIGGLRAPVRGILIVFLLNGLLHEYLAAVITGEITGMMVSFFGLHGIATALTFRLRLRGAAAAISWLLTMSMLITTSVLFFTPVDRFVPWYSHGSVLDAWRGWRW